MQLVTSSIVCSIGFATNSETILIGSMLVSPIGGLVIDAAEEISGSRPVTSSLQQKAMNLVAIMFVPFTIGFITGVIKKPEKDEELMGMGQGLRESPIHLLASLVVATCGGVAVKSAAGNNQAPSIGVGIATSLLPPLTAAGYISGRVLARDGDYSANDIAYSFLNFFLNILGVTIGVVGVNWYTEKLVGHLPAELPERHVEDSAKGQKVSSSTNRPV